MAGSFAGWGSTFYGKRDFGMDESYLTTEWVIIFGIPIYPQRSFRVSSVVDHEGGYYVFYSRSKTTYAIYEEQKPFHKQVLFVYSFMMGIALILFYSEILFQHMSWFFFFVLFMWCLLPVILRTIAWKKISPDSKILYPG